MAQAFKKRNKLAISILVFAAIVTPTLISCSTATAKGKNLSLKRNYSSRALRAMARVYMAYGEYEKAQPLAEKALESEQGFPIVLIP